MSLDIVLTAGEAKGLQARGLDVKVKKNKDGKSVEQLAAEQAASGYTVWRSWDEQGGIRDELYRLAKENPQLVKLVVLGHTYAGPRDHRAEADPRRARDRRRHAARGAATARPSTRGSGSPPR